SRDRLCDDGYDHRLRLLESGRGTGLGANGPRSFNGECGNGEESDSGRNSTDPDGAELAGTSGVGFSLGYRPQALAPDNDRKIKADFGTVSVATALRAFKNLSRGAPLVRPATGRWLQRVSFDRFAKR